MVGYSLRLEEGETLRIDAGETASPLAESLYRAAIRAGALPSVNIQPNGLYEQTVALGSEEQLGFISPADVHDVETVDALVTIWSEANTRSLTRADPDRHQKYLAARRRLRDRRAERIAADQMRWCGTLHPTQAHAQDAEMSLDEYEAFVFGACHVDRDDPAAHWTGVAAQLEQRAGQLSAAREIRVIGPDTDLRVGVDGRRWLPASGRHNLPDGEIYTSPIETRTTGEIRFSFPALFEGRRVEDVQLRFEDGRVTKSEATVGGEFLRSLLTMDDGASIAGEFAFGLNYEIDRFTNNILFDEKIGGTVHLAVGAGFAEAGGRNRSALHWDLITDLRADGEVYADGELIWKQGRFLDDLDVPDG